jgi:hypothetical protein
MPNDESTMEQYADQVGTRDVLGICRNHIESIQNLRYLASLDAQYPTQVRRHLRMMEWHLHGLWETLLLPS